MYDPLVYGKDNTERLVNVEIEDNKSILFIQEKDGSVKKEIRRNKFWLLTNKKTSIKSAQLKGNLHYQYGVQFSNKKDWQIELSTLRKKYIDFFTIYDSKESYMTKDGLTLFKALKPNEVTVLSFDIESTGLYHNNESKVLLISNTFRKNGVIERQLFCYDDYSSQKDLIENWCSWVRDKDPSLLITHNGYSFDLRYLDFVAKREGTELNLGRDGSPIYINPKPAKFRVDGSRDQEYHKVRVYGRDVIDTMFLAIKYDIATKKYDSYGLKSIIKTEGIEKEDRVHYDSSKIRFNYTNPEEWKKIKDYCRDDSDDSLALFDLMAPAFFYLTQSIPKTFQQVIESATGSQINSMMVRSYLQEGHSIPKASPNKPFEGAISFGNPGIYRNVHKVDVASLYPSIILECQVFDEDKDPKGNFLKIMETFTAERLKNKALAKGSKYHDDLQSAQKIVINSGYGFMGAEGLNFNSPSAAEFITKTGRDVLQISIDWAKQHNLTICNADTDSISYCKADGSFISEDERKTNLQALNGLLPDKIKFEDDGFYFTLIVLKAKNYVLYDGKKVKYKGSALKSPTKAVALREFMSKIINAIIEHRDNYQEIYFEYIKEACKVQDITRWASRKTISQKTLNSERKNESIIRDAIEGTEYGEGDRIRTFYKNKDELELVEKFNGEYDIDKLLQQCYDTSWTFETILDCENLFKNYKLKKNKELLKDLINVIN